MISVDDFLNSQVANAQTPSIQYAFFNVSEIRFQCGYGLRNVREQIPADPNTTYHLYSITKTFTALAVLQLAQNGKIDIHKPVINYLPSFPYGDEITILQLLNHTSGIPNPMPLKWIHLFEEHENFNRNNFFAAVFKSHPKTDFTAGTKFKYSNLGYVILGQMIEQISGKSYEEYIHDNIISVCNVDSSELNFRINPSTHAIGYHKWRSFTNAIFGFLLDKNKFMGNREGKWKPFNYFYNNGTPYGGLFGTAKGLSRYAQTLLQNNSPLINNQYKNILFTECTINNKPTGMSLSWFKGEFDGNTYFAHAGGGGGYYVELRLYPESGSGSVIMYNRSGLKDARVLDKTDAFFINSKV